MVTIKHLKLQISLLKVEIEKIGTDQKFLSQSLTTLQKREFHLNHWYTLGSQMKKPCKTNGKCI